MSQTVFVSTKGNDSNDGSSLATAFLTVGKALLTCQNSTANTFNILVDSTEEDPVLVGSLFATEFLTRSNLFVLFISGVSSSSSPKASIYLDTTIQFLAFNVDVTFYNISLRFAPNNGDVSGYMAALATPVLAFQECSLYFESFATPQPDEGENVLLIQCGQLQLQGCTLDGEGVAEEERLRQWFFVFASNSNQRQFVLVNDSTVRLPSATKVLNVIKSQNDQTLFVHASQNRITTGTPEPVSGQENVTSFISLSSSFNTSTPNFASASLTMNSNVAEVGYGLLAQILCSGMNLQQAYDNLTFCANTVDYLSVLEAVRITVFPSGNMPPPSTPIVYLQDNQASSQSLVSYQGISNIDDILPAIESPAIDLSFDFVSIPEIPNASISGSFSCQAGKFGKAYTITKDMRNVMTCADAISFTYQPLSQALSANVNLTGWTAIARQGQDHWLQFSQLNSVECTIASILVDASGIVVAEGLSFRPTSSCEFTSQFGSLATSISGDTVTIVGGDDIATGDYVFASIIGRPGSADVSESVFNLTASTNGVVTAASGGTLVSTALDDSVNVPRLIFQFGSIWSALKWDVNEQNLIFDIGATADNNIRSMPVAFTSRTSASGCATSQYFLIGFGQIDSNFQQGGLYRVRPNYLFDLWALPINFTATQLDEGTVAWMPVSLNTYQPNYFNRFGASTFFSFLGGAINKLCIFVPETPDIETNVRSTSIAKTEQATDALPKYWVSSAASRTSAAGTSASVLAVGIGSETYDADSARYVSTRVYASTLTGVSSGQVQWSTVQGGDTPGYIACAVAYLSGATGYIVILQSISEPRNGAYAWVSGETALMSSIVNLPSQYDGYFFDQITVLDNNNTVIIAGRNVGLGVNTVLYAVSGQVGSILDWQPLAGMSDRYTGAAQAPAAVYIQDENALLDIFLYTQDAVPTRSLKYFVSDAFVPDVTTPSMSGEQSLVVSTSTDFVAIPKSPLGGGVDVSTAIYNGTSQCNIRVRNHLVIVTPPTVENQAFSGAFGANIGGNFNGPVVKMVKIPYKLGIPIFLFVGPPRNTSGRFNSIYFRYFVASPGLRGVYSNTSGQWQDACANESTGQLFLLGSETASYSGWVGSAENQRSVTSAAQEPICVGPDTNITLHDGRTKKAKDVVNDDRLMAYHVSSGSRVKNGARVMHAMRNKLQATNTRDGAFTVKPGALDRTTPAEDTTITGIHVILDPRRKMDLGSVRCDTRKYTTSAELLRQEGSSFVIPLRTNNTELYQFVVDCSEVWYCANGMWVTSLSHEHDRCPANIRSCLHGDTRVVKEDHVGHTL